MSLSLRGAVASIDMSRLVQVAGKDSPSQKEERARHGGHIESWHLGDCSIRISS